MCVFACSRVWPLGLFEVLTRNRQSAVGLSRRTSRSREKTFRVCTILPRQQLSSPTRLAIRIRRIAHLINTQKHTTQSLKCNTDKTHTQREKEIQNLQSEPGSAKVPSRGYGKETFDGTRTKHPTEGEICTQPRKKHTKT